MVWTGDLGFALMLVYTVLAVATYRETSFSSLKQWRPVALHTQMFPTWVDSHCSHLEPESFGLWLECWDIMCYACIMHTHRETGAGLCPVLTLAAQCHGHSWHRTETGFWGPVYGPVKVSVTWFLQLGKRSSQTSETETFFLNWTCVEWRGAGRTF